MMTRRHWLAEYDFILEHADSSNVTTKSDNYVGLKN
jgi:hypothetical protein